MKERRFRIFTANFIIVTMLAMTMGIAVVATLPYDAAATETSAIYSGNKDGNSVCLMFNVYQNTAEVLQIAEIFDSYGFKTTYFIGGSWANHNGDAVIKLASDGFELGNHGYLHRDHAKLNLKANTDEILMTEKILEATLSGLTDGEGNAYRAPKLFAPPSGSFGKVMFDACENLRYKVIMWTRDTIDWRDQDSDLIFNRAVKDIKAGDLILMHPTPMSVKALPKILDYIKSVGLTADTVTGTLG